MKYHSGVLVGAAIAVIMPIAVGAALGWTEPVRPIDPVGVYACTGQNPDGAAYDFDLRVAKRGDSYELVWVAQGQTHMVGIGLLEGEVLSVAFLGQQIAGVAVYHVTAGRLVGAWTAGDGKRGTETCQVGRAA